MIRHNKKYFIFIPAITLSVFILSGCSKDDQALEMQGKLDTQQTKTADLQEESNNPEKIESTQIEDQDIKKLDENVTAEDGVVQPVKTNVEKKNTSNLNTNEYQSEQSDEAMAEANAMEVANAKAVADAKSLAIANAEAEAKAKAVADAKVAVEAKAAADAKALADKAAADAKAAIKTKIAIWKIDCSPSNIAEATAHYRQQGLDYIEKLREEGENIIEIREEKCRFIIVMEDK